METKVCTKCGKKKPIDEFWNIFGKGYKNNKDYYCKECRGNLSKYRNAKLNNSAKQEGTKICSKCKRVLSMSNFYCRRTASDGRSGICKDCQSVITKNSILKGRYGITIGEYDQMLIKQNYKCAICGNKLDHPYVDHNHETGEVRGLLCNSCNLMIGMAKESKDTLQAAIKYLDK